MVGNVVVQPPPGHDSSGGGKGKAKMLKRQDTIHVATGVEFGRKRKSLFGTIFGESEKLFALDSSRWTPTWQEAGKESGGSSAPHAPASYHEPGGLGGVPPGQLHPGLFVGHQE
jgi:hypothetical protein